MNDSSFSARLRQESVTIQATSGRRDWEAFLAEVRPPTFLQSWAWGETQCAIGEEVIRLAAYNAGEIVGVAQAVSVTARRGSFLHVPHGPVVTRSKGQGASIKGTLAALLEALRHEAERRKLAFLRVSPVQEDTNEHHGLYRLLGYRPAPIYLHSERLWVLDVTPDEQTLLAEMRKTTRNLVRRSERDGIEVTLSTNGEDLETFVRLYKETAQREEFVPFSRRLLEAELQQFGEGANIALAAVRGTPLAGAVAVFTPWSGFYHHGASSRLHPNLPASYALQWALIREAKRRGCREYNFWGIYPPDNRRAGITLFKTGFGGREVVLVPTQDLPLSMRYWAPYVVDSYRRWSRGL